MEVLVTEALRYNMEPSPCPSGQITIEILQLELHCSDKIIWNSKTWQNISEIWPENNELKECHTSGLENEIRLFASCSNEKECQNRGNSAKHKGVQELPKST